MKYKKLNFIILLLAFIGVLAWVIHEDGADNLLRMFRLLNPLWLIAAVLFMVVYWFLEAGILHRITRRFHSVQKFKNSLCTSMIGQLFNCITPFASGGQPVQAYHMVKTGVPLGISTGALMIKFIVYQFCLTIYSIVVLLFCWRPLSQKVSGFGYLVFIGFAINFAVMMGLLCICFFQRFTKKLAHGLVRFLAKIHILKHKEKTLSYIDSELEEFHKSFNDIKDNKGMVVEAIILSMLQLTAYFLIPYFICLAFGVHGLSMWMVISAQAFVVMISSFVPLPGAAGGAEYSFHTFFAPFFAPYGISVNLAMLLWRLITFYFPILAGSCFLFFGPNKDKIRLSEVEEITGEGKEEE